MIDIVCEPAEWQQLVGHTSNQPWQPRIGSHDETRSVDMKSPFLGWVVDNCGKGVQGHQFSASHLLVQIDTYIR